jgi:hypothetical protein
MGSPKSISGIEGRQFAGRQHFPQPDPDADPIKTRPGTKNAGLNRKTMRPI